MVQLKASVVDPVRYFNIGGCDYEKGDWTLVYLDKQVDRSGNILEDELEVGISYRVNPSQPPLQTPIKISDYSDALGAPYTSLNTLLKDLGILLGF